MKSNREFMMKIHGALLSAAGLLFAYTMPAQAHHSHAMFDDSVETTIVGSVSSVRFANPHVFLLVLTEEGERWAIEMSDIGNMTRRGFGADTFEAGDHVEVVVNPLRNGEAAGNYVHVLSINDVRNQADEGRWNLAEQ